MTANTERRLKEVEILRRQYPDVAHDEGVTLVVVRKVPLPGGWNRTGTDVLFFLGAGYPQTAPDNFFVPHGLDREEGPRLGGDRSPGAKHHDGMSWDQFSWHANGQWWPAADPEDGSNLLTFMGTVEARFAEGA